MQTWLLGDSWWQRGKPWCRRESSNLFSWICICALSFWSRVLSFPRCWWWWCLLEFYGLERHLCSWGGGLAEIFQSTKLWERKELLWAYRGQTFRQIPAERSSLQGLNTSSPPSIWFHQCPNRPSRTAVDDSRRNQWQREECLRQNTRLYKVPARVRDPSHLTASGTCWATSWHHLFRFVPWTDRTLS